MPEYNDLLISFLILLFNPLWFVLVLLLFAHQAKFIREVPQFWPSHCHSDGESINPISTLLLQQLQHHSLL